MEELVLKNFKILLVTILSATLLSGCSGCGIGLNNKQNVDDSNNPGKSVESDKLIDDISKFKITDVVSVNCVKGYPVNDFGFALCEEQTVNLIGLSDKGNLRYSLLILAASTDYSKLYEYTFLNGSKNRWLEYEEKNDLDKLSNEELLKIVNENDSLWIEYGESSLNDKASPNVDAYIWLSNDVEHTNDNFNYSYNYQMLRSNFVTYEENIKNTKYNDSFSFINQGEEVVLYGATVERIDRANELLLSLDDTSERVTIDFWVIGMDGDVNKVDYNPEVDKVIDTSSILKEGQHVYIEVDQEEEFSLDKDIYGSEIWGYLWLENNVYNNYESFFQNNYIGKCVSSGLLEQEDIDTDNKYYDKILRYLNGY